MFLKPLITSPLIEVGEYSYYDDPDHATEFETRNVTLTTDRIDLSSVNSARLQRASHS